MKPERIMFHSTAYHLISATCLYLHGLYLCFMAAARVLQCLAALLKLDTASASALNYDIKLALNDTKNR